MTTPEERAAACYASIPSRRGYTDRQDIEAAIASAIRAAVAEERAACVAVCREVRAMYHDRETSPDEAEGAYVCADRIEARGRG